MARLRVVVTGAEGQPEERSFAEAARAMLEQALADGAVVLALIVETPSSYRVDSVPDSAAVRLGLIKIARAVHDVPGAGDDGPPDASA